MHWSAGTFFASRVAKPECRTTIFTGRPDRLLFLLSLLYYFISIRFQAEVFASGVAKPEFRTTTFTGRPAVLPSPVAKPERRNTIFTGRPDRLLFYYFYYFTIFISIRFQAEVFASRVANLNVETPFSPVGRTVYYFYFHYFTISFPFGSRQKFFACRAANPTRPPHPSIFQRLLCISDSFFACRLTFLQVGQTYPLPLGHTR